jgi:thiol-disulfide isomerase/thioredoxin
MDPIVLRKADRSVAGRVVDAKGDPQARVRVQVSGRESRSRHVMTDSEGRFRCDGLVEESLELWVGSAALGEQPVRKRVKAGDTDVILVFTGGEQTGEAGINLDVAEQFDLLLGRPAPPLNAVAWVNAKPGLARELRGKVVLIDFWGIGCGPCVAALPGVQAAADQFNAKGAVVIGLHDSSATLEQLQAFAKQRKLTYPLAIDTTDEQKSSPGKTFRAYRVQGVPAVAVIDREGRVAYLGHSLGEALGRMGALLGQ